MNISMQLFLVLAACLCLSEGAPDGRLARKQQRPTRGFKNVEMMTARGFGKRDRPHGRAEHLAEDLKRRKYAGLDRAYTFAPLGVETLGPWGTEALRVFKKLSERLVEATRDPRADTYDGSTRRVFKPKNSLMVATDYGKRSGHDYSDEVVDMDDFLETLASTPEKEVDADEKYVESMPLDLLVMEMMNNPEFTRSVVRKFIDVNKDGMLSLDELLRNVA